MTTPPAFGKQPLMHPDANTAPLVAAAHRRSEQTRAKAIQALRELDRAGTPVTFEPFARHASDDHDRYGETLATGRRQVISSLLTSIDQWSRPVSGVFRSHP